MDKRIAPMMDQLQARYPVGNCPLFPDKRVYRNTNNQYWDLDRLRLQVWAAHMVSSPHAFLRL